MILELSISLEVHVYLKCTAFLCALLQRLLPYPKPIIVVIVGITEQEGGVAPVQTFRLCIYATQQKSCLS